MKNSLFQWNLFIRDTFVQRVLSLIRRFSLIGKLFRKSRIMTKLPLNIRDLSAVLCFSGSTIQHEAFGMRAIQITAPKKTPLD